MPLTPHSIFTCNATVPRALAIGGGRVFFLSGPELKSIAIDGTDPKVHAVVPSEHALLAADGVFAVWQSQSGFTVLDLHTGLSIALEMESAANVRGCFALIENGTVFVGTVGTGKAMVHAWNATSGERVWSADGTRDLESYQAMSPGPSVASPDAMVGMSLHAQRYIAWCEGEHTFLTDVGSGHTTVLGSGTNLALAASAADVLMVSARWIVSWRHARAIAEGDYSRVTLVCASSSTVFFVISSQDAGAEGDTLFATPGERSRKRTKKLMQLPSGTFTALTTKDDQLFASTSTGEILLWSYSANRQ